MNGSPLEFFFACAAIGFAFRLIYLVVKAYDDHRYHGEHHDR